LPSFGTRIALKHRVNNAVNQRRTKLELLQALARRQGERSRLLRKTRDVADMRPQLKPPAPRNPLVLAI